MEMVEKERKMKMELRREIKMAREKGKEKKMKIKENKIVKKKTYSCNFKENTCQK